MSDEREGADVKISGVTIERTIEMATKTWHVMALLLGLIWAIASYKTALDKHLENIDEHLMLQDRRLQWIINHTPPNSNLNVPNDFDPQKGTPRPQSWLRAPEFADKSSTDASTTFTER